MKAVLFPLAFLAAAVSAQSSACAANYIVEACLGTISGQLAACDTKDYGCQCTQYEQYVVCFDNCPNDQRKPTYEAQKQVYCGLSSQYPSSTSKLVSAPATTTTSVSTTSTDAADATQSSSSSVTSTGSAAPASKTNSAADLALNAGGILAAVAGVVAAVL